MASLVNTLSELYTYVSNFLGLTDMGVAPTSTDLTTCKAIVNRGYKRFLYPVNSTTGQPHNWSFLKQLFVVNTQANKYKYALPSNFSDILEHPHFGDGQSYQELTKVSPEQILKLRSSGSSSGYPIYYALAPFVYGLETGTLYEIWVDPIPDGVYQLKMFYRIDPIKPDAASDLLVGGVRACEAILESCLSVAEQQEDDVIGIHTSLANDLIQKLIVCDIQEDSDFLGNMSQSQVPRFRWYSASDVNATNVEYI